MGVVSVNRHGTLYFNFRYNGRRYWEGTGLKNTESNRAKCEKYMRLIDAEIAAGIFYYAKRFPHGNRITVESDKPQSITFREYADKWLASNAPDKSNGLSPSTYEDYTLILNNQVYPIIGDISIQALDKQEIKRLRVALNVSDKRIKTIFRPIRGVIAEALNDELIEYSPIVTVRVRRGKGTPAPELHPFSLKEIGTLKFALSRYWRLFLDVACFTGLRTSELLALRWSNVKDNYIQVREGIVRGHVGPPKNKSSIRDVLILPPARNALLDLMAGYCMERNVSRRNARGYWHEHLYDLINCESGYVGPYVFSNSRGGMWSDRNIRERVWHPALKSVGLQKRGLYQTRHTYASLMLMAGERPLWVANQMGHVDATMIYERYAKYIPGGDEGQAFNAMYEMSSLPKGG